MTAPHPPLEPRAINRPALATGVLGIGALVVGAIWPWLSSPIGLLGTLPAPWLLWLTVAAAVVAVVAICVRVRPRWLLIPVAVTVIAAIGAALTADTGWMCVDGFDADGNMVGGCQGDEWSPAPFVFAAGVALTVASAVIASVASPRHRG